MTIPTAPSSSLRFHKHTSAALRLAATGLLLLLGAAKGVAENPWTSSPMGWSSSSGVSSRGWSSWEATRGGTFGGSSSSFEVPRPRREMREMRERPEIFQAAPPDTVRDAGIDPVMFKAGSIAEHRAQPHSTMLCWRYVKEALVAAGGVSSYPQSTFARQAGEELVHNYGFVRLPVRSAERAPVGSVLVYGGPGAGHVELRTSRGFVSDYCCNRPSGLPFIGAFTRLEKRHKDIQTAQVGIAANSGS
jgi:hypothetical protein